MDNINEKEGEIEEGKERRRKDDRKPGMRQCK